MPSFPKTLADAIEAADVEAVHRTLTRVSPERLNARRRGDELTPLLIALPRAATGASAEEAIVRALLEHGADPNVADPDGDTPLLRALAHASRETLAQALLDYGAAPNTADSFGTAPIHYAAQKAEPTLERLLGAGANPNVANSLGLTPLLLAVREGDLESARRLLEVGADPNAGEVDDLRPLHFAARRGDDALVRLLLDAGADPLLPDIEGRTPRAFAVELDTEGRERCIELLRAAERSRQIPHAPSNSTHDDAPGL